MISEALVPVRGCEMGYRYGTLVCMLDIMGGKREEYCTDTRRGEGKAK